MFVTLESDELGSSEYGQNHTTLINTKFDCLKLSTEEFSWRIRIQINLELQHTPLKADSIIIYTFTTSSETNCWINHADRQFKYIKFDTWYSDELVEHKSYQNSITLTNAKFDCLKLSIEDFLWGTRTSVDLDQQALSRRA